jgi:uncharacterized repeat protein (TIGR01451 family)
MFAAPRTSRTWRAGGAALAGALGFIGAFIAVAIPSAFAESVTSPNGTVAISVPPPVVAGVSSTYTLTFTNTSRSATTNVVALGNLPAGMTLNRINNCARLGGNQSTSFNCTMPNLAPAASESATFSILASAAGSYDIPFGVAAAIPDPNTPGASDVIGDQATLAVNVQPGPTDIQVTGSANNGSPALSSTFTYTFQVKDNGPLQAGGVTFDDILPASIHLVGDPTADIGSCTADITSNSVHCDIGNLAVGQHSTISISATATTSGIFPDTATISMSGTDSHPANNSVTVTVQPR